MSTGGPPFLVDTHAHLLDRAFDHDLDAVLQRASRAGVSSILVVTESHSEAVQALQAVPSWNLLPESPFCAIGAGLHPERVANLSDDEAYAELAALTQLVRAERPRVAAVAEIGLDFRPVVLRGGVGGEQAVRARQRVVFERLARLAAELDCPVSVHSRAAGHHAIKVLREAQVARAVLHAFDGRAVYAEDAAVNSGYAFSVPACIVRSPALRRVVERVPPSAVLLESDAPALAAEVGARNEPAAVRQSLEAIAALQKTTIDAAATRIRENVAVVMPGLFARDS